MVFPDRTTPIGKIIDGHLKSQWKAAHINGTFHEHLDALVFQGLQTANRVECLQKILLHREALVCDRYWQSGFAYGVADGLDPRWLIDTHRALPQPDVSILLDIEPEEAFHRRQAGHKSIERYEAKVEFTAKVTKNYRLLWDTYEEQGLPGKWIKIPSHGTVGETQKLLASVVNSLSE